MRRRRLVAGVKCQIVARFGCAVLLSGLWGCTPLATVRTRPAQLPRTSVGESPLQSASRDLIAAEHEPAADALADDLLATRTCHSGLAARPNDDQRGSFIILRERESLKTREREHSALDAP